MFLASATLSLGAAAVQLRQSYVRDLGIVQHEFTVVEESFLPGLQEALWEFNFPLVEVLMEGIHAQADIVSLSLVADSGHAWAKGSAEDSQSILRRIFPLHYKKGSTEPTSVGTLEVIISLENIKQRLWAQFLTLCLSNFGKSLLAAASMLFIFDRMVSRHLRALSDKTRSRSWLQDDSIFALDRGSRADDEIADIVSALNDAVEQVRDGHAALERKSNELEIVNRELFETNREQAEFTYAISHDLKSPTNTMRMLIDEIEDFGAIGEDGHDVLADMKTTNSRMGQLVEDVLNYSLIVEERICFEPIDLNDLVDGVVQDLAGDITAANAALTRNELPCIMGHPLQIRILFQNLISNAVKFRSPERGSVIQIMSEAAAKGECKVTVADNGIGIPEKHRDEVFGLFKRLHSKSVYDGTGLGLTICRRIMTNHQGFILPKSGIDGGTAFELRFKEISNA